MTAANIYHLISSLARRLPYSLIKDAAPDKYKQAPLPKKPIPGSAVAEFKQMMGAAECHGAAWWSDVKKQLMQKWWAEPQRGQFFVTQCASF